MTQQLADPVQAAPAPDLVARIARGDRSAENEFARAYERGVRALARRHCRPGDPAVDDVVQDVLRNVLEQLRAGRLRDPAALPAYVRQAVVFAANAEYRKRAHRAEVDSDAVGEIAANEDVAEGHAARERAALVRELLQDLPVERDRELLRRFYVEERDKADVCRELGIDVSHFHRVVFRARERFRRLLVDAGVGND